MFKVQKKKMILICLWWPGSKLKNDRKRIGIYFEGEIEEYKKWEGGVKWAKTNLLKLTLKKIELNHSTIQETSWEKTRRKFQFKMWEENLRESFQVETQAIR